jgi:SAM-dependent methyltransferase
VSARKPLKPADLPLPPLELADRVGAVSGSDRSLEPFLEFGRSGRAVLERALPEDWSWEGRRVLDFGCGAGRVLRHFAPECAEAQFVGCDIDGPSIAWLQGHLCPPFEAFVNAETPPLAQPDASFDLVYAISVFTHITEEWSEWLLEFQRVLKKDGLLVASVLGGGMSETTAGEPWDPDRIGMNVLDRSKPWSHGGPNVLISEWWLRAHWGRIFDVLNYEAVGRGGQDIVLLRRRHVGVTREELERPEPGEARELEALRHNVSQLHRQSGWLRAQLEHDRTVREEELGALRSRAEAAEAMIESVRRSRSWRLTAPLRRAAQRRSP